ncbi:MAG: type II/IV secretion system protein, partial [Patescibacteria group bacterium]
MALNVSQAPPVRASGRQFVEYLVTRGKIASGFRPILKNRDLQQINQYLAEKNLVNRADLPKLYADYYGLPFISLAGKEISGGATNLIPRDVAQKFQVVPYQLDGKDIYIAIGRPSMLQSSAPGALLRLRQQKGLDIHLSVASEADVSSAIDRAYRINQPVASPPINQHLVNDSHRFEPTPPSSMVKSLNKTDLLNEVDPRAKDVDLTTLKIPHEVLVRIPYNVAKKYRIIVFGTNLAPAQYEPPLIQVGAVDPNETQTKEILAYIEQKNKVLIDRYRISEASLISALKQYPNQPDGLPAVKTVDSSSNTQAPVMKPGDRPANIQREKTIGGPPPQPANNSQPIKTTLPPVNPAPTQPPAPGPVESGLVLSEADITNKLTNEAKPIQGDGTGGQLDDQDLDKLLNKPISTPEELAEVMKRGVVPEIISALLFLGIRMKASDVHIEAQKKSVRFRYRIDGILHDVISAPLFMHAPLISRIKILSKMKIDEQRVPQDGRFDVVIDKRQVDLRVSTLPTVFGEKVVMRLLDKSAAIMSLEQLGITEANFDTLVSSIGKPYGIILSTGPTGSGKTTTLYAALNRISKPGINIITLEDPVEYELPGINQSQVKPQIGFTFADGLRSVLRQDPNVIMVGEIRDLETAAMATHAALTGHLVLSTLHTNDASGALPRLINMGVEPF